MDQATDIANLLADKMIAHRGKLQVDKQATQALQDALTQGAHTVSSSRETQASDAKTLLAHWKSDAADHFDSQTQKLGQEMTGVAGAGTKAAELVDGLAQQVTSAHGATQRLIDEYTGRATTLLNGAQAVQGAGGSSSVLSSFAQVIDLANSYGKETGRLLSAADGTAKDAATQLKSLTTTLKGDTIAVPKAATTTTSAHPGTKGSGGKHTTAKHGDGKQHKPGKQHQPAKPKGGGSTKTAGKIISAAKRNLGYHETGVNIDKFGPPGAPWCSYFATSMWRKAGVNIPNYGFTGDVYTWGKAHHLAYDANHLDQVRPGDVLLFGSGPQNADTSTHIAIVEAVHGNTVTTIEGNEGDAVRTETHTLSSSTFYGGVHP